MAEVVETDVLIIGAGPAGIVAATLLSDMGIKNIAISKYRSTSPGPRAHITNQRAMEILRDLGLEEAAKDLATPQSHMGEHAFSTSLVGEEFGRIRTWSTDIVRQAEHDLASPCSYCDLPQLYFEPLVTNAAGIRGSDVRFRTEYLSHTQDADGVSAQLLDRVTGVEFTVRAKYLIGADGARSQVAEDAGLPFEGELGKGAAAALNIEFTADLSSLTDHRRGDMFWMIQPGGIGLNGTGISVLRMVRPWNKWVCTAGYDLSKGELNISNDEARAVVQKVIGSDQFPIQIDATSTWEFNQQFAQNNTNGRVFCMGDAVHRHTPMGGLGLNTSVQDAYNLCWKLAMVVKEQAGPSLLATYDVERTPVGEEVVNHAYMCLSKLPPMFMAMGLPPAHSDEMAQSAMARYKSATPEGEAARAQMRAAINGTLAGFGGAHGLELNQRYEPQAVYPDGTADPGFDRDRVYHHQATSRPGAHVPHVWLTRNQRRVSTLDLCGKGKFTLLTGIAGEPWVKVAQDAAQKLGIDLEVQVIGPGQTYVDTYGDWAEAREVEEDGAILVRPDMFVAWRSNDAAQTQLDGFLPALKTILGRDG